MTTVVPIDERNRVMNGLNRNTAQIISNLNQSGNSQAKNAIDASKTVFNVKSIENFSSQMSKALEDPLKGKNVGPLLAQAPNASSFLPSFGSIGSNLASAVGMAAHENTAKYTELANSTVNNAIQNTTNNINNATDDLSKTAQNPQQLLLDAQKSLEEQFENAAQNTTQNVQNVSKNLKFNEVPSSSNFPSTPNSNTNLALQFPTPSPGGQFGMQPTYPQFMEQQMQQQMQQQLQHQMQAMSHNNQFHNNNHNNFNPYMMMSPSGNNIGMMNGGGLASPGGGQTKATFDKGNEEYYNNQELGQTQHTTTIAIDPNTRVNFMKRYVIKAYDSDLREFSCTRKWCFRFSNFCETGSLVCMGAAAIFAFLGAQGSPIFSLFAGVISTVGIVLKGFSHHASQEAKESSVKLNQLLKVLNLQGLNVLVNESGEAP